MAKKPYLQFVRALLVLATLAGFCTSNLMACRCAAKKSKTARASCCDKAKKEQVNQCCNKPAKKPARKVCCKKFCCRIDRKQDSMIENNQSNAAIAAGAGLRSVCVQNLTIPNKPLRQAATVSPCAAELCVFLC
ncbi:MAG: hypothetical protein FVQ82_05670 [Planctomycetes bacterium]|nr:hypothetical protein [Planctomycetota bacterium]